MPDRRALATPDPAASDAPPLTGWRSGADSALDSIVGLVQGLLGVDHPSPSGGISGANALGQGLPALAGVLGKTPEALEALAQLAKSGRVGADAETAIPIAKASALFSAANPMAPRSNDPEVAALGKPVSEMLGMTLSTPNNTGLPKRMHVSNWNAGKGELQLLGARAGDEPFAVSPADLSSLIDDGRINLAGQSTNSDFAQGIRERLRAALDTPASRDAQVQRNIANPRNYPPPK